MPTTRGQNKVKPKTGKPSEPKPSSSNPLGKRKPTGSHSSTKSETKQPAKPPQPSPNLRLQSDYSKNQLQDSPFLALHQKADPDSPSSCLEKPLNPKLSESSSGTLPAKSRLIRFGRAELREEIQRLNIDDRRMPVPRLPQRVTPWMLAQLADWLCELCDDFSWEHGTLHLAYSILLRFLAADNGSPISVTALQPLGLACLLISAKLRVEYYSETGN